MSVDTDRTGPVSLGSRQKHRQDPIPAFGLDAVRVHLNRKGHGAIKAAGQSLPTMHASIFRVLHCFGACEADRSALYLKFEVGLVNARNFSDQHQIIAFAENI
jgi:hypothetical protein